MADPFAKLRERKAVKMAARAAAATAKAAAAPIGIYEVAHVSRGWAILLLVLWAPIMIALVVLLALNERVIKDAIPYATGVMVLAMLLLFASLGLPSLLAVSRRRWNLFTNRLEIRQRPFIPLLGPYHSARIPFADIAVARHGEMLNGTHLVEIETVRGARYRLSPRMLGSGKQRYADNDGLDAFMESIGAAIDRAGLVRPPGEQLRTFTSGFAGLAILGTICAFTAALCLFGVWVTFDGEPVGIQALALGVPLFLLFGGLFLDRWRKWRAQRGA